MSETLSVSQWVRSGQKFMERKQLTAGFLNLGKFPIIRLVGGGQFRKGERESSDWALKTVCIVALLLLVLTVWITCWTQEEDERESVFGERKS